jgi:hypothetical protein
METPASDVLSWTFLQHLERAVSILKRQQNVILNSSDSWTTTNKTFYFSSIIYSKEKIIPELYLMMAERSKHTANLKRKVHLYK